jgi:hypothetical protein
MDADRHVTNEVVDVEEEVLVAEDVLLMGVRDEEVVSSHAEHSSKTLSHLSRMGSQEKGFQRPVVPLTMHVARRDGENLGSSAKL